MKILNSTTRDATDEIKKTPITSLNTASELNTKSLLHIIQYIPDNDGYQSMKMTAGTFEQKVYEAVNNTFKVDYLDLHDYTHCVETSYEWDGYPKFLFGDMYSYLSEMNTTKKAEFDYWKENDEDGKASSDTWVDIVPTQLYTSVSDTTADFVKHINFDFDLLRRYIVVKDDELKSNIDDLNDEIDGLDNMFDTYMTITTTNKDGEETHVSVNHLKTENDTYVHMSISDGNKISSEWKTPCAGNLVIYGWLDSSSALNNKSIPSSFCVIEGKINSTDDSDNWEILAVQPVIPAKTMTYVGFNIQVHKDLVIRARTGFTVGAKSGQYSNEQDGYDTLSNNVANGFKCQIYSRKENEV